MAFPLKIGVISLFGSYQRGGNFRKADIPLYQMNYHLLGGGLKYRALNPTKIYSPTISLSALTEVAPNYGGKMLGLKHSGSNFDAFDFFPSNSSGKIYSSENYHTQDVIDQYVYDYISTPLMDVVFIGNEFKLMNSLF